MAAAYLICVSYALFGLLYSPGWPTLAALLFIAVSASPLLLTWRIARTEAAYPHPAVGALAFATLFCLGLLNLVLIARSLDQGIADVLTPEGFVATAAAATSRRYEEGGSSGNPILLVLSLFLVYRVGAACSLARWWQQLLAFVPVLLYTLLSTEKWPLFLGGTFFLLGIFAALPAGAALRRTLTYATVFACVGGGLAAFALVLRGFDGDLMEIPEQLLHYVLAPFPAFGAWLLGRAGDFCCSGGLLTFVGPADLLGFIKRASGVFTDNAVVFGTETNIYTAWRYFVQDFGDAGGLLICGVAVVAYLACEELLRWRVLARAIRTFVLFGALISSNVTPFVHNSVALAAILAVSYSAVVQWRRSALRSMRFHEQA